MTAMVAAKSERSVQIRPWLDKWHLSPDGPVIETPSSIVLPVIADRQTAVLKLAKTEEESRGAALMPWYNGQGAALVYRHEENALLMERAIEVHALRDMARSGRDTAATGILCNTIAELHTRRSDPPPRALVPLRRWFRELEEAAALPGILERAKTTANALLDTQREITVLHGDVHHDNVLKSPRGWIAIDPKGLIGEREFDYANIFCNPDLETATTPDRLRRIATEVAATTDLQISRLLSWALAYAGLSAVWSMADGTDPTIALAVAKLAAAELGQE